MKRISAAVLSVIAVLSALVPGIWGGELRHEIRSMNTGRDELVRVDDAMGYVSLPFVHAKHDLFLDGSLALSTTYRTDDRGRRATPLPDRFARKKYAVFFGCSLTFGDNVNDDETLPCYFGRFMKDYEPYNYGFGGYGPQQMLAFLENRKIREEIRQSEGVVVYVFIEHHIQRAIGSLQVMGRWNEMPCYESRENQLVNRGLFSRARPVRSRLSKAVFKNAVLSRLVGQKDFPPVRRSHVRFVCSLIERSRQQARRQFGNDNFVVLVWRCSPSGDIDYLVKQLRQSGITCLDYRNAACLGGREESLLSLPDGHPTPLAYRLMAEALARDLKALGY